MKSEFDIKKALKVCQLMVGAMIAGVLILAGVVVVIGDQIKVDSDLGGILFPILLVFASIVIFMPVFMRRMLILQAKKVRSDCSGDENRKDFYPVVPAY